MQLIVVGDELDVTSTTRLTEEKQEKERTRIFRESLELSYDGLLRHRDRYGANLDFEYLKRNGLRDQKRPFLSGFLNTDKFDWRGFFSEFEDRNFRDGKGILTNKDWGSSLDLRLEDLPHIFLEIDKDESVDNLFPRTIDSTDTRETINGDYHFWLFDVYARREVQETINRAVGGTTSVRSFDISAVKGIASDGTFIYVVDSGNNVILKFTQSGTLLSIWGSFGSGPEQFISPSGIAVFNNFVYVVDTGNNRVQKLTRGGRFEAEWGTSGTGNGQFNSPDGITADSTGIYVTDTGNNRVQKFREDGTFVEVWGTRGGIPFRFNSPRGIESNGSHVFVVDSGNNRIVRFAPDGTFELEWGSFGAGAGQFNSPAGVTADIGAVYVADTGNNRIQKFTISGAPILQWGNFGTGDGQFNAPSDATIDRFSDVDVTDTLNRRIQKFTSSGEFEKVFSINRTSSKEVPNFVTKTTTEQVGGTFSYTPDEFWNFSASFDVLRITDEVRQILREERGSESRNATYQVSAHPTKAVTILASLSRSEDETDEGTTEDTGKNISIQLQPIKRISISASRFNDLTKVEGGDKTETQTDTFDINADPLSRWRIGASLSSTTTLQNDVNISESDDISITSDMDLYHGINLLLSPVFTNFEDLTTGATSEGKSVRATLSMQPLDEMLLTLTYDFTETISEIPGQEPTTSGRDSFSGFMQYNFTEDTRWSVNVDYSKPFSSDKSEDLESSLIYSSSFFWLWDRNYDVEFTYIGSTNEDFVEKFETRLDMRFKKDIFITITYDLDLTGPTKGDHTFYFQAVKKF